MTTCRAVGLLGVLLFLAPGMAHPQSGGGMPTEWPWAYGILNEVKPPGGGPSEASPWASSLPQLLVRDWAFLSGHVVTDAEQAQWKKISTERQSLELQKQRDQKAWELSRLQVMPEPPAAELKTARDALARLEKEVERAMSASSSSAPLPERLVLKQKSPAGSEGLPSQASTADALAASTGAWYLVTGTLKVISGYLTVQYTLTSTLEERVLDTWSGTFAPEEAPEKMHEASQRFLDDLLGGPWAGLDLASDLPGTEVNLGAEGWKPVPWRGEFLVPGIRELDVHRPGFPSEKIRVDLVAGETAHIVLPVPPTSPDLITVVTTPPGAEVRLDSRWIGLTPITVPRPLDTSRLKMGLDGFAPEVVEVGPGTPSIVEKVLTLPQPDVDLVASRDRFYQASAVFSFSLTATLFARALADQQLRQATASASGDDANKYTSAVSAFQALWYGSQGGLALTTGVFVWMMMTLSDYLSDAQTTLP